MIVITDNARLAVGTAAHRNAETFNSRTPPTDNRERGAFMKMKYDNLKAMRLRAKLSVAQIAKRCGVTVATVYAWQNGVRRPSDSHLWTLAMMLNADAVELQMMFRRAYRAKHPLTT